MAELKELQEKLEELSSQVVKLTDANAQLKKDNEEKDKKLEEQREKEIKFAQENSQKELFDFCEQLVKDGKMLPAQRDILCDKEKVNFSDNAVVITFSKFKDYAEKGGKLLDKSDHAESDDGTKDDEKKFSDPQDEVEARIEKYQEENPDAKYEEALFEVLDKDKKLAEAYSENYQASGSIDE